MEVIYDELLLLFLRPAPFILLIIIGELDSTPIIIQTSFLPGYGRAGTLQPDSEETISPVSISDSVTTTFKFLISRPCPSCKIMFH